MRIILYWIGGMLLVAGVAYWYGTTKAKVVTQEGESHTIVKDRVVTVIKTVKPDGTVTETTTTADHSQNNSESHSSALSEKVLAGWALGVHYRPDLGNVLTHQWNAWELEGSRRLLGPTWISATVNPLRREISLGIRYEF